MKQKSLDTIILEEAIRAKLAEQPGATISQKPGSQFTKNLTVPLGRGNWAATVADLIYNAKGYFVDDEEKAKEVIERNIKNIQQYKDVTKELQKLSGGRGLGAYLRSFMDLSDRLEVVSYLMDRLPANQWNWTVKAIVSWDDFKHFSTGGSAYQRSGLSGNYPKSGPAHRGWTKLMTLYADKMKTRGEELWGETLHDVKFVSSIATAVVPVIGPVISAAISLSDAKQYYDEGDKYSAGLITVLSLIPGGKAVAKALTRKIITKNAALTAAEKAVLTKLATNKTLVKEQLGKLLQKAVESGKITDAMLKSIPSIVKPIGKGVYAVAGTGIRIITPLVVYNQAWAAANPNVTEAEMKAVIAEEDKRLKREIDLIFRSALKQPRGVVKGIRIGETAGSINEFEFEPSDSTSQEPSQTAQNVAFGIGAGIGLAALAGKFIAGGSIIGIGAGLKKFFGINILKPRESFRLIRDTRRINRLLKSYTRYGKSIGGFTVKEYRAVVRQVNNAALQDLRDIVYKVETKELTPDAAAREFAEYRMPVDTQLLKNKLGQVYKSDQTVALEKELQAIRNITPEDEIRYLLNRSFNDAERDYFFKLIRSKNTSRSWSLADLAREAEKYRAQYLQWRLSNPNLPITDFKI